MRRLSFLAPLLLLALCFAGCATTTQGKLDQAKQLYTASVGELDDLREAGLIDAKTYHNNITPARRAAWAAIQKAEEYMKAGMTDQVTAALNVAQAALLELQKYRATPPTQPLKGVVDPISGALLVLGLLSRLAPVLQKAFSGQELTEEERKTLDEVAASENARADRLDAEAAKEA